MSSLEIINGIAKKQVKPVIISDDMNAEPESDFIKGLQQYFLMLNHPKVATYPATEPKLTIDYIAIWKETSAGFANIKTQTINEPTASDHLPVISHLRNGKKTDEIFTSKPYLQNPVDSGITVMWKTSVPTYSWVEYGTDKDKLKRIRPLMDGQIICNNDLHKVRIEGLLPRKKYYYISLS